MVFGEIYIVTKYKNEDYGRFISVVSKDGIIVHGTYADMFQKIISTQTNKPKSKFMNVIKNAFKSKEQKALDYFNLDNDHGGLNDDGRREMVDYLFETNKELRKGFLAKIIETYQEAKKK